MLRGNRYGLGEIVKNVKLEELSQGNYMNQVAEGWQRWRTPLLSSGCVDLGRTQM